MLHLVKVDSPVYVNLHLSNIMIARWMLKGFICGLNGFRLQRRGLQEITWASTLGGLRFSIMPFEAHMRGLQSVAARSPPTASTTTVSEACAREQMDSKRTGDDWSTIALIARCFLEKKQQAHTCLGGAVSLGASVGRHGNNSTYTMALGLERLQVYG